MRVDGADLHTLRSDRWGLGKECGELINVIPSGKTLIVEPEGALAILEWLCALAGDPLADARKGKVFVVVMKVFGFR